MHLVEKVLQFDDTAGDSHDECPDGDATSNRSNNFCHSLGNGFIISVLKLSVFDESAVEG